MTKIISVSDEVYDYLKSLKGTGESFTKLFKRMAPDKDSSKIMELAGCLDKDDEFVKIMHNIVKSRSKITSRTPKFD